MENKRIAKAQNFDFGSWCEQQNKKKKALLSGRIFVVVIFWAIIISYLVSPFSKAKIVLFEGNTSVLTQESVYSIGEFEETTFWWNVDLKKAEEKIKAYADGKYVLDVDLQYSLNGLSVKLEENIIVGKYLNANNDYVYILRSGDIFVGDARLDTAQYYYDKKHLSLTKNIPNIEYDIVTSNTSKDVVEELGKLDQLNKLYSIEKADLLSNIEQYKLTFKKEKTGLDKDLVIIVSLDSMVHSLNEANFESLLVVIKNNATYVSGDKYVAMYGPVDVGSDKYGFLPYPLND